MITLSLSLAPVRQGVPARWQQLESSRSAQPPQVRVDRTRAVWALYLSLPLSLLLGSRWAPPWSSVLQHPSSQLLCSVGQFSLSSGPAVQLAFPCHLDLEDLFSVSSAFGHCLGSLTAGPCCSCSGHPVVPFIFLSHPFTQTRQSFRSASMTIGFGLLNPSHSPTVQEVCVEYTASSLLYHVFTESVTHHVSLTSLSDGHLDSLGLPGLWNTVWSQLWFPLFPPTSCQPHACLMYTHITKKRGGRKTLSFSAIL